MVSKWLGFSGVLFAGKNSCCRVTAKDHLDGKNEVLGGAEHERFWKRLRQKCPHQFKGSQLYGAISVIKRLWAEQYLKNEFDLDRATPVFQPVNEIAERQWRRRNSAGKLSPRETQKSPNIVKKELNMKKSALKNLRFWFVNCCFVLLLVMRATQAADMAATNTPRAVPWSAIGAKAGADYKGDGRP
jgi:hypothetical protein